MANNLEFLVEDAVLIFKNFKGEGRPMNAKGNRNFCVVLPPDTAEQMAADGWLVKYTNPRDEGDVPEAYIQVKVSYKNRPPRITLVTSKGMVPLPESSVETLDYMDIRKVDLFATGYEWVMNEGTKAEKSRVKAYLKTMFVHVREDPLESKYGVVLSVPDEEED